ncbi:MAG: flavodoxin family protein [Parvularcula sp.]|jgi:multimeric flavodoxin WrbA|nr:flavodoxin family protein [Parvularcula sp.]
MTKIAIIYHSGYGHTKLVADAVRDGVENIDGVEAIYLTAKEAEAELENLGKVDGIIFGSPTYMGSVAAPLEKFFDATSKVWGQGTWKDKLAGGFTNSGSASGDKVLTLQRLIVLAAQHGMIWVSHGAMNELQDPDFDGAPEEAVNRLGGYLGPMAQSENAAPGPDNPPQGDIKTARLYGERFARAAKRWGSGPLQ